MRRASSGPPRPPLRDGPDLDPPLTPEFERIRWFPLPGEALAEILGVEGPEAALTASGV
ncbi:MAG TPA: hypothetical protein VID47_09055 [Actinomycetota bacterium]|jgi:hypothetical protein